MIEEERIERAVTIVVTTTKNYKELKNEGYMVGEFDILIAAIIIANQKELVARDEHFELLIFTSKLLKGQKKRSASEIAR